MRHKLCQGGSTLDGNSWQRLMSEVNAGIICAQENFFSHAPPKRQWATRIDLDVLKSTEHGAPRLRVQPRTHLAAREKTESKRLI